MLIMREIVLRQEGTIERMRYISFSMFFDSGFSASIMIRYRQLHSLVRPAYSCGMSCDSQCALRLKTCSTM